jgi:hypothetical protein
MKIKVDRKFITQRNARSKLYKANGRPLSRLLMDIECELYEYEMIKKGIWKDDDNWQIDGHAPFGSVDVKCVKAYYNVNRKKLLHILKQRDYVDYFYFIEWKDRPTRLLKTGDEVEFNYIGKLSYDDLIKHLKISFKTEGYYVDARKTAKK